MTNFNSLRCTICLELILNCRTAICGHSFCEVCIAESLLRKRECPMCRKEIRRWGCQKSELIDEAVNSIVKSKVESEDAQKW